VVTGIRRPLQSFLSGSYGHSIEYLELIIDTSCIPRFPVNGPTVSVNSRGRQRDFETQRNREMAIAEWAVHMVESLLTQLRKQDAYDTSGRQGEIPLTFPATYTCLTNPHSEKHSRLRMEGAAYILISSLLSKRHTKKFNMRIVEAQLMNACLAYLNYEKQHGLAA
jgi:hypothetical protein